MIFKEMDPEVARRAIQGHEDVLGPAHRAQEAFYRQFRCPTCNVPMEKEFRSRNAFNGEDLLPRALLRCPLCRYLLEPHSNITLEVGNIIQPPTELDPLK